MNMQLNGAGFTANEPVSVYWGNTQGQLEGTTTTDAYGNLSFSFTVPSGLSNGSYLITVLRTNQSPHIISSLFNIITPTFTSTPGIRIGQNIKVKIAGFLPNEQVTISWDVNGGQEIDWLYTDQNGATTSIFAPPSAPAGSHTLTALGYNSGIQLTTNLNIGPGIGAVNGDPGSNVTIYGGGFAANDTLNVYFQTPKNGVVTATTDATGAFTASLNIPSTYNPTTHYYVYAVSTTTTDSANAQFFYATPTIDLACCYNPIYGNSFTLTGQGFAAQEIVTISAQNIAQQYAVKLGTATAASDGTFTFTSTMPSAPYTTVGVPTPSNMTLIAHGNTSKANAFYLFFVRANIIPTPGSGKFGQKIHLNGGGFANGETVTISMGNTQVTTATTDTNGAFHTTFTVPPDAQPGNYPCYLCAVGSTSGTYVNADFIVLPSVKITPTKGPSGTTITVSGNGYFSYDLVSIYWFDPSTNTQTQLTSVYTNGNTFQTTITSPSNLTTGTTYSVVVQDSDNEGPIQVPFLAT